MLGPSPRGRHPTRAIRSSRRGARTARVEAGWVGVKGGGGGPMPELPHGRFPGPAPPAELLRGWGWPGDVFGGSWGGGFSAGRAREGRSYPDRTVSPAHPSPSHARGLRGVVSSGRFEKARGGRGRGQGPERRACSDWPGAATRFSSLGPGPRPSWVRCCVSCLAGVGPFRCLGF